MEWQPIESARALHPKNADEGKTVMMANADTGGIFLGVVCETRGDDGAIRRGQFGAFVFRKATHWAPLPPPPHP